MPDLYPNFPTPVVASRAAGAALPRYPRGHRFLFDEGRFELDGGGRVALTSGYEAWAAWCMKAALTPRNAYLAYSPRYGSDLERLRTQPSRGLAEALIRRTVTEALTLDPRTRSVTNFGFDWSGDELLVSFLVTPAVGTELRIEVRVTAQPGQGDRPQEPRLTVASSLVPLGLGG